MPHYGSLLSSIVKDIVPRYHTMQGKRVERKWGWDCHGLPIEEKVQKKLDLKSNADIEALGVEKFIEECYTYTKETSAEWDWYIDHIGRWVDTEKCYKTMDQDYMESVLWVFKQMHEKGRVYKGRRVSLYSWKLSTPISNFEVAMDDSYEEVSDPAVTVMFPLTESHKHVRAGDYIIAWTTTPWTIPAHMSMALNKNLSYSRVSSKWKFYILATARVETVFKGREFEIVDSFTGEDLIVIKYSMQILSQIVMVLGLDIKLQSLVRWIFSLLKRSEYISLQLSMMQDAILRKFQTMKECTTKMLTTL